MTFRYYIINEDYASDNQVIGTNSLDIADQYEEIGHIIIDTKDKTYDGGRKITAAEALTEDEEDEDD